MYFYLELENSKGRVKLKVIFVRYINKLHFRVGADFGVCVLYTRNKSGVNLFLRNGMYVNTRPS